MAGQKHNMTDEALKFTEIQEAELHRLVRFYRRETERCREAKAFLAGCVLAGAELETALLLMVTTFPDEAAATNQLPRQKKRTKPLAKWELADLLRVAKAANWLPFALEYGEDDWNNNKAKIGDYVEVVREMRNLVHPARYMEDHYKKRVTSKHLEWVLNVIDSASGWLYARIEKSLIEHMKAEDQGDDTPA